MNALLLALALHGAPDSYMVPDRISLDAGWRFALGDHPGAEQPRFDDSRWRRLDLPHDWSIEGTPTEDAPGGGKVGFFPSGTGWYRKAFKPDLFKGRHVSIEFDGVYMNAEVWINGVRLGQRPYGYIGFSYDLTPHLVKGTNVIAVRVDNSKQPNSRWYTGSGIYRHVWLSNTAQVHAAQWGITLLASDSGVLATTRVINSSRKAEKVVVRTSVAQEEDPGPFAESTVEIAAGDSVDVTHFVRRRGLATWSIDSPSLHTAMTEVRVPGKSRQLRQTLFGVRMIAYDKDKGFLLNGERVKMRGVNLHHDAGALGAAVPEQVWVSRLKALKAMGVNAIRTSHNPPAPEFLDLTDRMGFLVMAEAFDEWTLGKVSEGYNKYFAEWSERDLTDFVRRDRNHPSIVLWSAGNEIGEQTKPEGVAVLKRLMAIIRREDSTRPITTGNDNIAAEPTPATLEFLSALDIVGYNYVDRWRDRRELFAEEDRHAHPEWKMIGTESGTIFQSFDEQYSLGTDPKVVKPNYTHGMLQAERLWKWVTLRDYFAGNFMWTGLDYLGESTWPFKGFPSGALDIIGDPKDAYYFYQSLWTREPVLRLFPHWNWPGREGQVIPVLAYSNCNSLELFLNGRSLGEKRMEFPAQGTSGGWNTYAEPRVYPTTTDLHLSWDVPYEPGELKAVGKRRDGSTACNASVRTAGTAAAIRLEAERDTVTRNRGDVAMVRVSIVDAQGNVVPTANARVCYAITGGAVMAIDNGDLQDLEPYGKECRKLFNGRGLVIARSDRPGSLQLTATAPGLASASAIVVVREWRYGDATPQ